MKESEETEEITTFPFLGKSMFCECSLWKAVFYECGSSWEGYVLYMCVTFLGRPCFVSAAFFLGRLDFVNGLLEKAILGKAMYDECGLQWKAILCV